MKPTTPRLSVVCCAKCASLKVQGTAWMWLNTNTIANSDAPTAQNWCARCDAETTLRWIDRRRDAQGYYWTMTAGGRARRFASLRPALRDVRELSGVSPRRPR